LGPGFSDGRTGPDWRWQGLQARGHVTRLTGLWSTGKTALLSVMLGRRKWPDLSGAFGRNIYECHRFFDAYYEFSKICVTGGYGRSGLLRKLEARKRVEVLEKNPKVS
jgi:hypothetical protein